MGYKIYVAVTGGKYEMFASWKECKRHIDAYECEVYRGFNSSEEADAWANEKIKAAGKIYVAINPISNEVLEFKTWAQCNAFVEKHRGAKFKSCKSRDEAVEFVNANVKKTMSQIIPDTLYACTYCSIKYGIGYKIMRNGKDVYSKRMPYVKNGEVIAVEKAIEWALAQGEQRIIVAYSFMGIPLWANGTWAAKDDTVKAFLTNLKIYQEHILIDYIDRQTLAL